MTTMYEAAMERLDEVLNAPVVVDESKVKEHIAVKANVVAAERGEFTAVVSTERQDREKDIVRADAMAAALKAWDTNGKLIPLAWHHLADDPDELIGHINPSTVKVVNGEVIADGWLDRDTQRGRQVWRLIKSNTLSFSFGYLILDSVRRRDGVREISKLDVFEISAVSTPANADTRVLAWKSTDDPPEPEPPSLEELRDRERELERELGLEDPGVTKLRDTTRDTLLHVMGLDTDDTTSTPTRSGGVEKALTPAELKAKCERIAREHTLPQIAVCEC